MATTTKSRRRKTIEAVVTVTKFTDVSHPFSVVRPEVSLAEFAPINGGDYHALGYNTPLQDATARFIAHLESLQRPDRVVIGLMADESGSMHGNEAAVIQGINDFVAGMGEVKKIDPKTAGTVLAVIATDGHENASVEVTQDVLAAKIALKEKEGWTFIFLGAQIDAWSQGMSLGLSGGVRGQTVSYENTPTGTYAAMASVTTDAQGYLGNTSGYAKHRASTGTTMRSVTADGAETIANINASGQTFGTAPVGNVTIQNMTFNTSYADVEEALKKAKEKTS